MPRLSQGLAVEADSDESRFRQKATAEWRRRAILTLLVVTALVGVAGLRVWQWTNDPRFCLLTHESTARWIRANRPFSLTGDFTGPTESHFLFRLRSSGGSCWGRGG